ncbi:MAG TPA: hypothetical protein V6C97_33505 [Oculatellaceae cyanobacterium]
MCHLCNRKVGNDYTSSTMSRFRPVVDAARHAARPKDLTALGGFAVAKVGETMSFTSDVFGAPLVVENDGAVLLSLFQKCSDATVVAFEMLDNWWPDKVVFDAIKLMGPNVTILRIKNGNGSIEVWDLNEVYLHFDDEFYITGCREDRNHWCLDQSALAAQ